MTIRCVALCVCVSGGLLYVVFQELFSSSSPNKIYGKAFNKVRLDPEVRIRSTLLFIVRYSTWCFMSMPFMTLCEVVFFNSCFLKKH